MACALAAVPALAVAAGCGFHLRGQSPLPAVVATPFVDAPDRYTALYAALDQRLRAAGARPAANSADASAVIRLHLDDTGRELLSVTADNKPGEYEVYYAVTFSLRVGNETLLSNESLVVTRAYTYDETQVLAKAAEEEILRRALAEDLARRVMQRIQTLGATAAAPRI